MPILIPLLLKYFWFGIIFVGILNAWVVQRRARPLIVDNPLLQFDANRVSITLILMIGIPSALLGVIQLMAVYESPFYIFADDLSDPYLLSAWLVMAGMRLFILYWLWFTNGLESYLAVTPMKLKLNLKKPDYLAKHFEGVEGISVLRWSVTGILLIWFVITVWSFV
jgi:hypothetical protein